MNTRTIKVRAGKYMEPMTLTFEDEFIFLKFNYNKALIDEVKNSFEGARWVPERKQWKVLADSRRNAFRFAFMEGKRPYAIYDQEIAPVVPNRPSLYAHQNAMTSHILAVHYGIWACEMGTGKTLAAIEAAEQAGLRSDEVWYVGPRSGVRAVSRELIKWDSKVRPRMLTYEGLVKAIRGWIPGRSAPRMVIYDESSKIKTHSSQRSKAAKHLADAIWEEHGMDGYVLLMSGTPAPKTPADWWHQCEVACPGMLRESNYHRFKHRMCLIEERESISGGAYPHLVTWLDDDTKCSVCGEGPDALDHHRGMGYSEDYHDYVKSRNEVELLFKRMQGLVIVQFKKDCLDLPEKRYEVIQVKPKVETLRAAKLIAKSATRAAQKLGLLRELSDGFQYKEVPCGMRECPNCYGEGKHKAMVDDDCDVLTPTTEVTEDDFTEELITCEYCGGSGEVTKYEQIAETVSSPKDDEFINQLDSHREIGRFIVWGGFTATIDRLVVMAMSEGWAVLRVDGRGYQVFGSDATADDLLSAMDASDPKRAEWLEKIPRVCFVGQPQAGGMALTLTASPTNMFYSNCFNGEARMQAEDRFHRAGMDTNRGATIIDLYHLPTDKLVHDNLKQKKRLQDVTMGEIGDALSREDNV